MSYPFSKPHHPAAAAKCAVDATAIIFSFGFAFYLRFEGSVPPEYRLVWWTWLPMLLLARIVANAVVTGYRRQWRSTGLTDLAYLALATVVGSAFFLGLLKLGHCATFGPSLILLEAFISLNVMAAMRAGVRIVCGYRSRRAAIREYAVRLVLVVGAGDAGQRIVRQMKEDVAANLSPVGFLDDDPAKFHRLIHGVPVLGAIRDVEAVVRERSVDQILIAIPSLSGSGIAEIVRACSSARADLTILPTLPQLLATELTPNSIRKVSVEDLLERSPIRVDVEAIAAYTTGQRILVTGAGGSIGSELCRQIVGLNPESLVLLGQDEESLYWIEQELRQDFGFISPIVVADIKDRHRLEAVFRKHRPTVVFHAAAHKHVPMMEDNPEEAVKNNVFGTRNLAELAMQYGVHKFVMISTDKAVNPTSVMGTTKRVAEKVVQSFAQRIADVRSGAHVEELWGFESIRPERVQTAFSAVRFGNVLGSSGSVIPTMERQISKGGPVTVTHPEMTRYFMTIPEAVQLVIQAGGMGVGGEVFVLDMGRPVRIMDLAWNLIRLSGLVPNVDIQIQVTGVRPGEKLYEEVLTAEEGTTITSHAKIHVARASRIVHGDLKDGLDRLWRAATGGDADEIRDVLAELVPSYARNADGTTDASGASRRLQLSTARSRGEAAL